MKAIPLFLSLILVALSTSQANAACRGRECPLYIHVSVAEQLMYVYENGELVMGHPVSTGIDGFDTPTFAGHPITERIYKKYSSKKFPGGNYVDPETGEGLGNMPYAMFYDGGFAIHGTPLSNWAKIGTEASHGCIRMYSPDAKVLNQKIRYLGAKNVWFFIDRERVGTAEGQEG